MPKTRHLTEIEKSIVLGHAANLAASLFYDSARPDFLVADYVCCFVRDGLSREECTRNCRPFYVTAPDELALYLDYVTVEVE